MRLLIRRLQLLWRNTAFQVTHRHIWQGTDRILTEKKTCLIVYPLQLVLTVMPRVLLDSVRLHGYSNGIHGYTHGFMDGPMESMGTPMEPMGVSMDSMCIPMVPMCIPMNSMGARMESVGTPMDSMVSIALDDSCLTMIHEYVKLH